MAILMDDQTRIAKLADLVARLAAQAGEGSWFEFKQNNESPEEIGEYISALSNTAAHDGKQRGYLVWGVHDVSHDVVGTTASPSNQKIGNEDIVPWLTRLLNPQIFFDFTTFEMDGKRVVVLEIDRATTQPTSFRGTPFIRVGSYKKKLRDHPEYERRLWRSFDHIVFERGIALDRLTSDEVVASLDYGTYFALMNMPVPGRQEGILEALASEDMIQSAGSGRWDITNLGAALFAHDLDRVPSLRRKRLRVIQYRSKNRVHTVKEHVIGSGYATGFQGAIEYINGLLPSNEVTGPALRQTVRMYPEIAVRELVANALIHQDFSVTGTGPLVEIFEDRLEITNPGKPLIDPDRFVDLPPRSRNERLADVMRRAGICEERGSGWDKVGFQIELYQLPAPLVEVPDEFTRVVLFGHRDLARMDREDRVRAVYLHACLRYVTGERVTNTSVRGRFGIEARNSARASRLIKDAVDDGMIAPRNAKAARSMMEYVPFWASSAS
jgi:ATP-dependent DNA helicase RecG